MPELIWLERKEIGAVIQRHPAFSQVRDDPTALVNAGQPTIDQCTDIAVYIIIPGTTAD